MTNLPYLWTLIAGLMGVVWAFWSPLLAWIPLIAREAYLGNLLRSLRQLKVKHIPQLSEKANELLRKHPHYYWEPIPGALYRSTVSLAGLVGLGIGIVGAVKGSWISLGIAIGNFIIMMALAPRFDPTGYLSPEYAAAHEELISYVIQERRERYEGSQNRNA